MENMTREERKKIRACDIEERERYSERLRAESSMERKKKRVERLNRVDIDNPQATVTGISEEGVTGIQPMQLTGRGYAGGNRATARHGGAIGEDARTMDGGAVGSNAIAEFGSGAVGQHAMARDGSGAIGHMSIAEFGGGAVGYNADAEFGGGAVGFRATAAAGGAVGHWAVSDDGGAIGEGALTSQGGAVGRDAVSTGGGGAVGDTTFTTEGGAVGAGANAGWGGAVGAGANAISGGAIGSGAIAESGFSGGANARSFSNAIQLGTGTNSNPNTLQVYGHRLLDADGKIPEARLPDNIGGGSAMPQTWVTAGTANALTIRPNPVVTQYEDGMRFFIRIHAANTAESVSIAVINNNTGANLGNRRIFLSNTNNTAGVTTPVGTFLVGGVYLIEYRGTHASGSFTLLSANPTLATLAEAQAGSAATVRSWSPQRVAESVRRVPLTGLATQSPTQVLANDNVLTAVGKLQAQVNAIPNNGGGDSSGTRAATVVISTVQGEGDFWYQGGDFGPMLQQAHDSLPSWQGGKILIHTGNYLINTPVNINRPCTIIGMGGRSTYLTSWSSNTIFNVNSFDFGLRDLHIENMGTLVNSTWCHRFNIENCEAKSGAINLSSGSRFVNIHNNIFGWNGAGVIITNPDWSAHINISANSFSSGDIRFQNAAGSLNITDNLISQVTVNGTTWGGSTRVHANIKGNTFSSWSSHVVLENVLSGIVIGNSSWNSDFQISESNVQNIRQGHNV
ncbi:MAG: hypothetical protein FWE04_04385 [Oscillospiraceae bacterium]|nr:hypothetical protein [Oscillospiraceae bacterium]